MRETNDSPIGEKRSMTVVLSRMQHIKTCCGLNPGGEVKPLVSRGDCEIVDHGGDGQG